MRPEDLSKEEYTNWLFEQARAELGGRPAEIGMTTPRVGKGRGGMGEPGEMAFATPPIRGPRPDIPHIDYIRELIARYGNGSTFNWNTLRKFFSGRSVNSELMIFMERRFGVVGTKDFPITWMEVFRAVYDFYLKRARSDQSAMGYVTDIFAAIARVFRGTRVNIAMGESGFIGLTRKLQEVLGGTTDFRKIMEKLGFNYGFIFDQVGGKEGSVAVRWFMKTMRINNQAPVTLAEARDIMSYFGKMKDVRRKINELQAIWKRFLNGETIDTLTFALKLAEFERLMYSKQEQAVNRYREILRSKGYTNKQINSAVKQFKDQLKKGENGALSNLNTMLYNLFKYIAKAMAPVQRAG